MLKLTAALGAIALLSFNAIAEPELKGTATELAKYLREVPKTTTLSGTAEVRVPAHRAVVNLKLTSEDRSLQEALRTNHQLRRTVSDQLKKRGIPEERIAAAKFSSTPRPGIFTEKARSFKIENLIRVTVMDESEFNGIAAVVDAASEVQFAGVEFEYADKEASKEKALAQACDKVNLKKSLYEEKFGVRLVPVSFREGDVFASDAAARDAYSRKGVGYFSAGVSEPSSVGVPVPAADSGSFGEIIYTARVAVEYSVVVK